MGSRILALLLAFGVLCGCGAGRAVSVDEREAVEGVLAAYAESMAAAYVASDASLIAEQATVREQDRLRKSIYELAVEGRSLRPELRSLSVESIERAGNTSVSVITREVWDLRVVATGTEQLVSESLAQENRLSYSLVRDGGRWLVLSRQLRASSEGL